MTLATQRQDLLEVARLALLRLNPPSYGFADAALSEVHVALQVISVIAKLHPKSYKRRVTKVFSTWMSSGWMRSARTSAPTTPYRSNGWDIESIGTSLTR